MDNQM